MNTILNLVGDCIIVIDKYGNIQFCNEKILSKLLYKENDLINSNISNILNCNKNDFIKIIRKIKVGEKISIDLNLIDNKKNLVEFSSKLFIDKFNDKEYIYILLTEINNKSYDIDDLEILLDSLPLDIWIKNLDGKYLYTNQKYADRFKSNKEDMIGRDNKFYWKDKNNFNKFLNIHEEVLQTKMPKFSQIDVIQEDKKKCFEMYNAPIFDENKKEKYTIGLCRDISLKNVLRKGIYENNKRLSNLDNIFSVNKKEDKNIDELLENITLNIADSLEADGVAIFLYEEENKCIKLCKTQGFMDLLLEEMDIFYLDESLKKSLYDDDMDSLHNRDIAFRRALMSKKLNKKIEYSNSYKLVIDREFVGILSVAYLEDNKPKFDNEDFIKMSCDEIAMIIKNYRLSNELKAEFEKRMEIEKDLEIFLDISTDTIATIDKHGKFTFISPTANEISYNNENYLLNKEVTDIIHPDDKDEVISIFENKSKSVKRKQHRFLDKNGEYKWFEWNHRYINEKESFIVTARDITKDKKEEEQRKALESAIQLESLKNEFFANISHEFKTPINIILGTMQLLDKYVTHDNITMKNEIDLIKYVKSTKQNSYRLLKLVNNLIDMTRIDTGFYELQLGNYNIINIVESITLSVANYIENKGINLIFDTNEEEVLLACDPDKIERILLNLLSNSIKYTDNGGDIFVKVDVKKDKVKISIKDTGLGISKEKLPYIFERYKQGDHLLTRNSQGSGIGLSLVKSLVEMHDGKIYVRSKENIGTKLTFELPIRLVDSKIEINEEIYEDFKIEKCNIEFSDIYS